MAEGEDAELIGACVLVGRDVEVLIEGYSVGIILLLIEEESVGVPLHSPFLEKPIPGFRFRVQLLV